MSLEPRNWLALIVDDEPHNVNVIQYVLEFHKARTHIASSGHEGLELLDDIQPDFILLDLQMPGISGFEVLEVIRTMPHLQHLVVIALTAYSMTGDREKALKAGFDGYITKPINVMTVIDEIKLILKHRLDA
ncbi:MAG: response regulator [Anaerolineae bacterium]|jgi:CheY-like chemotaxis protein|nr:response regulator [Anaerolineae bacterium]